MTPNRSWFEQFSDQADGLVLLGDNKPYKIEGIGSIKFKFHDGAERILTEVRYVPELKREAKLEAVDWRKVEMWLWRRRR